MAGSQLPGTTLLDMAVIENKPMKKAIMIAMFKGQLPSPAESLPIEGATSLSQQSIRMTDAGTPTTRNVGEQVSTYAAKFSTEEETLKIIENKITIDKVLLDVKNYVQDPIALQTQAYGLVIKNTLNNLLISGDPGADVSDPAGLDYRFRNDATFVGQAIDGLNTDVKASDANRHKWFDFIDEAVSLVRGQADYAYINRQTWLNFRSALRRLNLLDTTKDQFDREIMTYGNTKFVDAGQAPSGALSSAAASQVIGHDTATSTMDASDTTTTPMYFVNTQSADGIRLLQLHPLRVTKPGIDPGDPGQFVVDVTWPIGFLTPQKFCMSSIQGLRQSV